MPRREPFGSRLRDLYPDRSRRKWFYRAATLPEKMTSTQGKTGRECLAVLGFRGGIKKNKFA